MNDSVAELENRIERLRSFLSFYSGSDAGDGARRELCALEMRADELRRVGHAYVRAE